MAKKKTNRRRLFRFYPGPRLSEHKYHLDELIKVYEDLEANLAAIRRVATQSAEDTIQYINVKKLMGQLIRSKQKLEQKISNTLLMEKTSFRQRFNAISRKFGNRRDLNY